MAQNRSKKVGRPRSQKATDAVLRAALALAHKSGPGAVTIDQIVERSGVAKTTIYRRWPNASAVIMDAFLADVGPIIRYARQGDIRTKFVRTLAQLSRALAGRRGDLLRHLLGAAQSDSELSAAFWRNWIAPRRQQGKEAIASALARGEIAKGADADLILDTIFGAFYYRLTIPYEPITQDYIERLVRQVFDGLGPQDKDRRGKA